MQSVEFADLDKLDRKLEQLLAKAPEKRRTFHDKAAAVLKTEVDRSVGTSGLNDSHGRIRGWQQPDVGSGGGYAAIRAIKGETGANSPGAITNYLENGHKTTAKASVDTGRWRSKKFYVDGYHYYANARATLEGKLIQLAQDFAEDLAKELK